MGPKAYIRVNEMYTLAIKLQYIILLQFFCHLSKSIKILKLYCGMKLKKRMSVKEKA